MAIFSGIVAFFKAIPVLDSWLQGFVAWYVQREISHMKKEVRDGIRKAITDHDQMDLEKAIGNPNPGSHSGIPSTVVRPSLPGVHKEK